MEGYLGLHIGNGPFQLAVVKDNGNGFIADEAAGKVIAHGLSGFGQEVGGDVVGDQGLVQRVGNGLMDLVPGQGFIPGDLESLADGVAVAHEAHKPPGKVRVEGKGPQGGTVARDNDGLALQDPADHLPGAVVAVDGHGDAALVIGMAGADDGDREAFLPVLLHEEFLTGDLVPGILPVGIRQGGALGDHIACGRLQVSGGGADVDVLPRLTAEEAPVPFHLVLGEADELADGIKELILQDFRYGLLVVDVRGDGVYAGGNIRGAPAPVQEPDVPVCLFRQPPDNGHADGSGSADEECFHETTSP